METQLLRIVDKEIEQHIDKCSDDFWASADRDPREDMHAYMQYPAMMVPEIQRKLIEFVCGLQSGVKNVLDPFVGAATTMTSCMSFGLNFTGQDVNPLAILVSRTKSGPFDEQVLEQSAERVFSVIISGVLTEIEADFVGIDKWFQPQVKIDLAKIRYAIKQENELWVRRFFWVALAETVRLTSNSRTSTYKLHIRPRDEIEARNLSAVEIFHEVVLQNLEAMKEFKSTVQNHITGNTYKGNLAIHLQDSSETIFPPDSASQYDFLITSPPYGDNLSTVPYGQFSYLPLQWIDLADIDERVYQVEWLRTTQEIDRRSLGGKVPTQLESEVRFLAERSPIYQTTAEKLRAFPEDRLVRVTSFLSDLNKTLDPIVDIMRSNAYMIWIVGNRHVGGEEIPTDQMLEELLGERNVKLVKRFTRRILYRRMASRNQLAGMMRQEHVLVFRKQGD